MTKNLIADFRTALISMVIFSVLCGLAYPLLMTGVAQAVAPGKAGGSVVEVNGQGVGSSLIGQDFTDPKYFHPRPSATSNPYGDASPYNASASSGSNLGPSSQALIDAVAERAKAARDENGLAADAPVPVDAVTASASGLDPHISPAYAELQVARVAKERKMNEDDVRSLVHKYTDGATLFVMGEPRVNVLRLNIALDAKGGQ
jgi:K+-transporting ATPase ATPase C chain